MNMCKKEVKVKRSDSTSIIMQLKGLHCALIVIFLQWCVISYFINDKYNHYQPNLSTDYKREDLHNKINLNKQLSDEIIQTQETPLPHFDSDQSQSFEGVAITLLLGSPKWFSRRFSVMVHNMLTILPHNWGIQIYCTEDGLSQENIDMNIGLKRLIENNRDRFIVTILPTEKVRQYKKRRYLYFLDKWLWESVVGKKVLVFGGNGAFCSNSLFTINDFIGFDYIGIPWRQRWGKGGGGEFSIRNKDVMIEALSYKTPKKDQKEDDFFVQTLMEMNDDPNHLNKYIIASKEETEKFAGTKAYIEHYDEHKETKSWEKVGPPFVVQGTLPSLSHDIRESFLSLCPELKIIFPVLHSPHCFGAHPNSEKCAETICALRKDLPGAGC